MFTPDKHVMSAYVPSAFVSDRPEDRQYLQCLTSTLTAMTTIPQLCTGSCVKKSCTLPRVLHMSAETSTTVIASL